MTRLLAASLLFVVLQPGVRLTAADTNESIVRARELYAAAAYEDALLLLNRLRSEPAAGAATPINLDQQRAIEQYRAFCLLALGRVSDAEQAIEAVVAAAPGYQPSEAEASPRVRAAFSDVRRRMLPSIVQGKYAAAKRTFDAGEFANAAEQFEQVLEALKDPDLGAAAAQPPLADLRVLAGGFRDLSVKAATPPPLPAQPVVPPPPSAPAPARIYAASDTRVVPPIAIRQQLPPFPAQMVTNTEGILEVVVDERGAIESAAMRVPMHPRYDPLAVAAARTWMFRPATLDGVPVKFRKIVQIALKR